MRAIKEMINLNVDKLMHNKKSQEAIIFGDPFFTADYKEIKQENTENNKNKKNKNESREVNYDVYKLLLIGYLYCKVEDKNKHINNLWEILNPKMSPTIPLKRVE